MAEKAWMSCQTVAHSYTKLLWKFSQNPWTALDFAQLSHRSQAQIGEPRYLSNDSKNEKNVFDFFRY